VTDIFQPSTNGPQLGATIRLKGTLPVTNKKKEVDVEEETDTNSNPNADDVDADEAASIHAAVGIEEPQEGTWVKDVQVRPCHDIPLHKVFAQQRLENLITKSWFVSENATEWEG
jgi:hypothetical protein